MPSGTFEAHINTKARKLATRLLLRCSTCFLLRSAAISRYLGRLVGYGRMIARTMQFSLVVFIDNGYVCAAPKG